MIKTTTHAYHKTTENTFKVDTFYFISIFCWIRCCCLLLLLLFHRNSESNNLYHHHSHAANYDAIVATAHYHSKQKHPPLWLSTIHEINEYVQYIIWAVTFNNLPFQQITHTHINIFTCGILYWKSECAFLFGTLDLPSCVLFIQAETLYNTQAIIVDIIQ